MREILFRGKGINNGEWIEGFLFHKYFADMPPDRLVIQYKPKSGVYKWTPPYMAEEIIPDTVSEFTGLTDKNGKRIFEGDIVAGAVHWLERTKNGVVVFRDGSFGLIWHRGEVEQFAPFTSLCNVEYEVIGNIHDNSDLLEGGESDA